MVKYGLGSVLTADIRKKTRNLLPETPPDFHSLLRFVRELPQGK
jgi:hypothetical protein